MKHRLYRLSAFVFVICLISFSTTAQMQNTLGHHSGSISNPTSAVKPLLDGGFEEGTPNPYWDESSTNWDTPICHFDFCPSNFPGISPRNGEGWAWFSGGSVFEQATVSQTVTVNSLTQAFTFYISFPYCRDGAAIDGLWVTIDGVQIWGFDNFDSRCGQTQYWLESFPLTAEAEDPGDYIVGFESEINIASGLDGTHFLIDDVSIIDTLLPLQLTSFTAQTVAGDVILTWAATANENLLGYEIQIAVDGSTFEQFAVVQKQPSSSEPCTYTHRISDLTPGRYSFRLRQFDLDGNSFFSSSVDATIEVSDQYFMESAFPNPFNPITSIQYAVSVDQHVSARLHNVLGTEIRALDSIDVPANEMQMLRVDASGLPSGLYIVRLTGEHFSASQRVMLLN